MEIQRHALVKRDYLVPFVLVTSLFFLWGFAHAILDVLNKHFQEVMDITRTHSAMVQVMFYLGYFIMAIPAGLFITKYGYRNPEITHVNIGTGTRPGILISGHDLHDLEELVFTAQPSEGVRSEQH